MSDRDISTFLGVTVKSARMMRRRMKLNRTPDQMRRFTIEAIRKAKEAY